MPIHEVEVEQIGPGRLYLGDLLGEPGEIGRQE